MSCSDRYKKSHCTFVKKVHKDCCEKKKDKKRPKSAFRAVKNSDQVIPANTSVKVLFQTEQFDIGHVYNPITSIFTPEKSGIYLVIGTITFSPNDFNVNYRVRVEFRVNGSTDVIIDNDFFGPIAFANVASVSTILQLKAGDKVEVYAESSIAGTIRANSNTFSTHFESARF